MAIRVDASTDAVEFNTSAPSGDITAMAWVRIVVDNNNFSGFILTGDLDGDAAFSVFLTTGVDGTTLNLWGLDAVGARGIGTNLVVGTWYHMAVVTNTAADSAFTVYLDGVSDITGTLGAGTYQAEAVHLMRDSAAFGSWCNGRMEAFKFWNRQLTQAEVQTEMRYIQPLFPASLWQWCPLLDASDNIDYSGNGRNFTLTGITSEDGPPISWAPRRPHIGYFRQAAAAGITTEYVAPVGQLGRSGEMVGRDYV